MHGGFGTLAYGIGWLSGFGAADHDLLLGVSANDHHAQAHTLSGGDHSGNLAEAQHPATFTNHLRLVEADDVEVTTTSATVVDLITAAVSVAVGEVMMVTCALRTTAAAGNSSSVGLKLNSTIVRTAVPWCSGGAGIQQGGIQAFIGPRATNYLRCGTFLRHGDSGNTVTVADTSYDADAPNATITSVVITGLIGGGTLGSNLLRTYEFPV